MEALMFVLGIIGIVGLFVLLGVLAMRWGVVSSEPFESQEWERRKGWPFI